MTHASDLAMLEKLYDAHHRQAIGLAYRILGDLSDAEEAVQKVFLAAWRSGHPYDPTYGSTRTWILSTVRNHSIEVLRSRPLRLVQSLPETLDPPYADDAPCEIVPSADAATARQVLRSLAAEEQQIIELAYFAGLSHREIATQLAAPVETVTVRIRFVLDRLRVAF